MARVTTAGTVYQKGDRNLCLTQFTSNQLPGFHGPEVVPRALAPSFPHPAADRNGSSSDPTGLEDLAVDYWHALYASVRRRGYTPEQAEDLTQEFFSKLLQKHWLYQARGGAAELRPFLFACLRHFLANECRRVHTRKRGGGTAIVPLDEGGGQGCSVIDHSNSTPEVLLQRRWVNEMFKVAHERLHRQYARLGKESIFAALQEFLLNEAGDGEYRLLALKLAMSPEAVSTAVCRLRRRYRETVRREMGQSARTPGEFKEELRASLCAFA